MAIARLGLWRRPENFFEELFMKEKEQNSPNDPLPL